MKKIIEKIWMMSKFFIYMVSLKAIFLTTTMAHPLHSQSVKDTYVSFDWHEIKLEEAFINIQMQTPFFFSYDRSVIDIINVTGRENELLLSDFLYFLSGKTGLQFAIEGSNIYVYQGAYISDSKLEVEIPTLARLKATLAELRPNVIFVASTANLPVEELVRGKVVSATGEPLIGVSIQISGTGQGTTTDVDGTFTLAVPDDAEDLVLVISYVGYTSQEVPWEGQTEINVIMHNELAQLNEVVVIGYGTGTKEKFNGAVSKVDAKKLNNFSSANFEQALAGNIAGLQVLGNGKNPGDNSVIQIRGLSTLTAGTNPLIVIDGNPLTEGSSLSSINTQDIASISVLKDAASAAIYGSRASNGVILITTKKGQGKLSVTYDGYLGFQQRADNFELADAYGTAQFDTDARNFGYISGGEGRNITDDNMTRDANGGGKRSRIQPFLQDYLDGRSGLTNTDWSDAVFRTAAQQNHYLNLSGGNDNTDYSISFSYFKQDNIIIDSDYQRYTNNFQLNSKITEKIRFGISSNIALSDANPTGEAGWSNYNIGAGRQADPAFSITLMQPYYPIHEADGSLAIAHQIDDNNQNWDGPISENTLAHVQLSDFTRQNFRIFGNTYVEIEPINGFKLRSSFGGDYGNGVEEFFAPSIFGNYRTPVENNRTAASKEDTKRENFITENLLTYNKGFGQHTFDVLVGYSYQQEKFNRTTLSSRDFTDDNIRNIAGATNPTAASVSSKWALQSFLSRVQYSFGNRYSLSASLRRDGSSRFGANTKYGNFASISAGWTLSNESFFPQDGPISFAKIRASWGQTGNNQIGNFASIALIDQDNYVIEGDLIPGSYVRTSPNADLSWETNTSVNLGLDLGFLDNKLLVTAEYYTSNTTDLLLNVPVPQQSGFSQSLQNIGELDNHGFELEIRGVGMRLGSVGLATNVNLATNSNEVVALGSGQEQIIQNNGGMDFLTRVGEGIAQFYAYDIIGVYRSESEIENSAIVPLPGTEVGDYIVRDVNNDGQIDPDDRTPLGDYNPSLTYGFGFNLDYKGFDLGVQFNGIVGRKVADRMMYFVESGEGFFVPTQYYVDNYFSDRNPDGFFRRPDFASFSSAGRLTRASSLSVLDGDYFRLRSLQLGYTFSETATEKIGVEDLRIYITGNNLFNITDYRGFSADGIDTRSNTRQTLTRGWIQSASPLTRFLAFGINIKL